MGKIVVPDFETVKAPSEESWGSGKEKKKNEAFEKQGQEMPEQAFEEKVHMDVVSRPQMETVSVEPKVQKETLSTDANEHIATKVEQLKNISLSEDTLKQIEAANKLGEQLQAQPEVKEKLSRRRKKEIKRANELRERREQQRAELDKLNNQLAKEAEERRALEKEEQRKLDLEMEQRLLLYRSQYIQGMRKEEEKITKSDEDLKMARLQELEKKRALEEKQKQRRQQQRMRMESEFEKYHIEDRGSNIIGFKQKRKK